MPYVIAYTYQSDTHTPEDAVLDWHAGRLVVNNHHPHALPPPHGIGEHGLPDNLQDAEGNLIHPVFDTDEGAE